MGLGKGEKWANPILKVYFHFNEAVDKVVWQYISHEKLTGVAVILIATTDHGSRRVKRCLRIIRFHLLNLNKLYAIIMILTFVYTLNCVTYLV